MLDGQRGFPSVLLVLLEKEKASINELSTYCSISQTAAYNVIPALKELDLIYEKEETSESSRGQKRKNYYLTDKGKRVAEKLNEINKILKHNKR